nr:hypothetical protein [Treponema sp.]
MLTLQDLQGLKKTTLPMLKRFVYIDCDSVFYLSANNGNDLFRCSAGSRKIDSSKFLGEEYYKNNPVFTVDLYCDVKTHVSFTYSDIDADSLSGVSGQAVEIVNTEALHDKDKTWDYLNKLGFNDERKVQVFNFTSQTAPQKGQQLIIPPILTIRDEDGKIRRLRQDVFLPALKYGFYRIFVRVINPTNVYGDTYTYDFNCNAF